MSEITETKQINLQLMAKLLNEGLYDFKVWDPNAETLKSVSLKGFSVNGNSIQITVE